MSKDAIHAAMTRAVEQAVFAEANPAAALLGEFPGHSRAGTATVWVDAVGRLVRLELARGTIQEGDEVGVVAAVMEAYADAVATSSARAFAALPLPAQPAGSGQDSGRRGRAEEEEPSAPFLNDSF